MQYLGSMLIKDLRGTESTQDACAKMRVRLSFPSKVCGQTWRYVAGSMSEWQITVVSLMPVFNFLLLQRSTEQMRKVPTIVLSITYKGVKFIDAANKVGLNTHDASCT